MRPVVVGLIAGLLGAAASSQLLRSQLYGVSPFDFVTFATIAALCATRVDPMIALRSE